MNLSPTDKIHMLSFFCVEMRLPQLAEHREQRPKQPCTCSSHNDSSQQNPQHNCKNAGLEIHIQKAGSQSSGPGACTRKRDSDEQKQRQKQSPSGLCLKCLAALFPLLQTEGEETSDHRLILAPFQYLARKEINKGYRKHISDDCNDVSLSQRNAERHRIKEWPL